MVNSCIRAHPRHISYRKSCKPVKQWRSTSKHRTSRRGSGKIPFWAKGYRLEANAKHSYFVKYFGHFLSRSTKLTISSQFYISAINVTIKEKLFQLTLWLNGKIKNINVNWSVLETCCTVLMRCGVKLKNG